MTGFVSHYGTIVKYIGNLIGAIKMHSTLFIHFRKAMFEKNFVSVVPLYPLHVNKITATNIVNFTS